MLAVLNDPTQKKHNAKCNYSTERTESNLTAFIALIPPSASGRPKTILRSSDRRPHARARSKAPTPNQTLPLFPGLPAPSLFAQDLDKIPCDCLRTSPIITSSSTSASRKSSIANTSGVANVTTSKTKPDHIKSPADIWIPHYVLLPTIGNPRTEVLGTQAGPATSKSHRPDSTLNIRPSRYTMHSQCRYPRTGSDGSHK